MFSASSISSANESGSCSNRQGLSESVRETASTCSHYGNVADRLSRAPSDHTQDMACTRNLSGLGTALAGWFRQSYLLGSLQAILIVVCALSVAFASDATVHHTRCPSRGSAQTRITHHRGSGSTRCAHDGDLSVEIRSQEASEVAVEASRQCGAGPALIPITAAFRLGDPQPSLLGSLPKECGPIRLTLTSLYSRPPPFLA